MATYKCPITTCGMTYTGSLDELIPPAQMHSEGSHKMVLNSEDIIRMVNDQANLSQTTLNNPYHVPRELEERKKFAIEKWWTLIENI